MYRSCSYAHLVYDVCRVVNRSVSCCQTAHVKWDYANIRSPTYTNYSVTTQTLPLFEFKIRTKVIKQASRSVNDIKVQFINNTVIYRALTNGQSIINAATAYISFFPVESINNTQEQLTQSALHQLFTGNCSLSIDCDNDKSVVYES